MPLIPAPPPRPSKWLSYPVSPRITPTSKPGTVLVFSVKNLVYSTNACRSWSIWMNMTVCELFLDEWSRSSSVDCWADWHPAAFIIVDEGGCTLLPSCNTLLRGLTSSYMHGLIFPMPCCRDQRGGVLLCCHNSVAGLKQAYIWRGTRILPHVLTFWCMYDSCKTYEVSSIFAVLLSFFFLYRVCPNLLGPIFFSFPYTWFGVRAGPA